MKALPGEVTQRPRSLEPNVCCSEAPTPPPQREGGGWPHSALSTPIRPLHPSSLDDSFSVLPKRVLVLFVKPDAWILL